MKQIKSKNTKPELLVRKYLFKNGYRYRIHRKDIIGNPDICFIKYKIAIFINGCFWHGHSNCKKATIPKTNTSFWRSKINNNKNRDIENKNCLENSGWSIITIWTCELNKKKANDTLNKLLEQIDKIKCNKALG